jgi:type III secretory pathway component EscT
MASSTAQVPTGVSNEMYDLISVLYHSLESCATEQTYIQDAQKAGDNDLVQFFQQCQQQDRQCAQQAQQILKQKMAMH